MHGFMSPAEVHVAPPPPLAERARATWKKYKWFTIVVLLPVGIAALYLFAFASNQYVSEAHFLVRSQSSGQQTSAAGSGVSSMLGSSGSAGISAVGESMSVSDYLTSHDVIKALSKRFNLVEMFRRPEADLLSRLPVANPTPEFLLDFYNRQVEVYFDLDTGITTLEARAFRPQDAYALSSALLQLGEQRVNVMNLRGYIDAVALSKRQLDEADKAMQAVTTQMTGFRQTERDVDPTTTASAQISLISKLQGELSAARSQLQTTSQLIGGSNPQSDALRRQITALEQQLATESARAAGGGTAIAAGLGNFESLKVRQLMLQERYSSASTAYEQARQNAIRQQLYVVRVVEPNMPVKSLYPQRILFLITLFAALTVVYAIGWLIAAGVREHSV